MFYVAYRVEGKGWRTARERPKTQRAAVAVAERKMARQDITVTQYVVINAEGKHVVHKFRAGYYPGGS